MKLKTLIYLAPHLGEFVRATLAMRNQEILSTRDHLRLCADWLLNAQRALDEGGYAASYSLITGLRRAYIETTGYIVPTMFDLAAFLGDPNCRDSALKAGEWLLTVQQTDGSFTDIDEFKPQVFDTGQVLLGLNRLYRETSDARFLTAARRAGDWLAKVQDADGSWSTMGYHRGQPSSYHTRVAAAVLELAQLAGEPRYQQCAVKNLRWAASRQQANGFFLNAELSPGADPVLHTMVYVLEGFLMAYRLTREQEWLEVLLRGAKPLQRINLERDLVLRSQYDAELRVTNPEKCIPGLAQWAGVCLHLHEITNDSDYLKAAQLSIYYLKSKQLRASGILHGALPASVPLWGYYHPMLFPNWAVKFFADALLAYQKHNFAVWQEQELWVRQCFELQLDGGGWKAASQTFGRFDLMVCNKIEAALSSRNSRGLMFLDVGCGEGRYLRRFQDRNPSWRVAGVDPLAGGASREICQGSACKLPFPDAAFDAALASQTLQHIAEIDRALAEFKRVLKPGGILFVADRDRWSGRGWLKPYHELRGRWMYPWDSPFRERWYSRRQWRRILMRGGFDWNECHPLTNPGEKGLRRLLGWNRLFFLRATSRSADRQQVQLGSATSSVMEGVQRSARQGALRPIRKIGLSIAKHWPWPAAVRLPNGRRMYVDLRSPLGRAIYMKGSFDPKVFEPIRARLRRGGCFLDVGANVGYYSMLALDLVGPQGAVHAFEVDPRPLRCLRKTIAAGRISNLLLHEMAVGNHDGAGHLVTREDSGDSSVEDSGDGRLVPMTTLDTWHQQNPQRELQVIKLDIEGGELAALQGAMNLLRTERPLVVCEVIEEYGGRKFSEPRRIFQLLESIGYRLQWLDGTCDPTVLAEWHVG